jgi:outer membrane protein TolC
MRVHACLCLALAPSCANGRSIEYDDLARAERVLEIHAASDLTADEVGLAQRASLDAILAVALARNPSLAEAEARTRADAATADATGRLPDLEAKYEMWGVPLARPWRLDKADTLMLGVRQSFPPGRAAERRAAVEDAAMAADTVATRQLGIEAQVRQAYFAYVLATDERQLHLAHVDLTQQLVDAARANFRAGKGSEAEILRLGVEITELHRDLAQIDQQRVSSMAMLNTLMHRDVEAPLGPPDDVPAQLVTASLSDLQRLAEDRPELRSSLHAIARASDELDAAERRASWPTLMIGADYWFLPMRASGDEHAYGAMISVTLPWLNLEHRDRARAAGFARDAETRALDETRDAIRFQVSDAFAGMQAARDALMITRRDLVPEAERSFEAARAAFATGSGDANAVIDAARTLLDARLDEQRALVGLAQRIATLQAAVGADVPLAPIGDAP